MPYVGMFAAKTHLSALVEQALAGEEIVLTRHGEPVARIVPYAPVTPPARVFGALAHLTPPDADWSAVTEPMSQDELRLWEGGDDGWAEVLERAGALALPVSLEDAALAGRHASGHRDPWDRLIAAQAVLRALPVVSNDAALDTFDVTRIW